MPDGHLEDPRDRAELAQVLQIEIVSGVHPELGLLGDPRRVRVGLEARFHIALAVGGRVRLGVELDPVRADHLCPWDLVGLVIHEQAHARAEVLQFANDRFEACAVLREVPAVVRGERLGRVGHERALRGLHLSHDLHVPGLEGVALDVELDRRDHLGELVHVRRPDVPLVGPRVNRDPVGARVDADLCRTRHARDPDVSRVPEQRYLIDVHAEFRHWCFSSHSCVIFSPSAIYGCHPGLDPGSSAFEHRCIGAQTLGHAGMV